MHKNTNRYVEVDISEEDIWLKGYVGNCLVLAFANKVRHTTQIETLLFTYLSQLNYVNILAWIADYCCFGWRGWCSCNGHFRCDSLNVPSGAPNLDHHPHLAS